MDNSLVILLLNGLELICLHTIKYCKCFHLLKWMVCLVLLTVKGSIIIIIIIIIMSRHQHGYPWPSLSNAPYRPLLPAGLQDYILYRHRAAICRFEPLLGHVKGSTGAHLLWARPCFSSSVPACLVRLILIVFVMVGRWPYSCCFVGCYLQNLFNIARSILV